jgi:hypothetical protein
VLHGGAQTLRNAASRATASAGSRFLSFEILYCKSVSLSSSRAPLESVLDARSLLSRNANGPRRSCWAPPASSPPPLLIVFISQSHDRISKCAKPAALVSSSLVVNPSKQGLLAGTALTRLAIPSASWVTARSCSSTRVASLLFLSAHDPDTNRLHLVAGLWKWKGEFVEPFDSAGVITQDLRAFADCYRIRNGRTFVAPFVHDCIDHLPAKVYVSALARRRDDLGRSAP